MSESVICQDCLRVLPYTDERHSGREVCPCGGDLCGCSGCEQSIVDLAAGEMPDRVKSWTPENGAEL